jgi:hypothetical protein
MLEQQARNLVYHRPTEDPVSLQPAGNRHCGICQLFYLDPETTDMVFHNVNFWPTGETNMVGSRLISSFKTTLSRGNEFLRLNADLGTRASLSSIA